MVAAKARRTQEGLGLLGLLDGFGDNPLTHSSRLQIKKLFGFNIIFSLREAKCFGRGASVCFQRFTKLLQN